MTSNLISIVLVFEGVTIKMYSASYKIYSYLINMSKKKGVVKLPLFFMFLN